MVAVWRRWSQSSLSGANTVTFEMPSLGLVRLIQVCPFRMGRSSAFVEVPRVMLPASRLVRPRAKSTPNFSTFGLVSFTKKERRWPLASSPTSTNSPTLLGESIHSIGSFVTKYPSFPHTPASKITSPPTGATMRVGVRSNCPQRPRTSSASFRLAKQPLPAKQPLHSFFSVPSYPCMQAGGVGGAWYAGCWEG